MSVSVSASMILQTRNTSQEHPICPGYQLLADPDVSRPGVPLIPLLRYDICSSHSNTTAYPLRCPAIFFYQHRLHHHIGPCYNVNGPICARRTIRLSSNNSPSSRSHHAPGYLLYGPEMPGLTSFTSPCYDWSVHRLHLPEHWTLGHPNRNAQ